MVVAGRRVPGRRDAGRHRGQGHRDHGGHGGPHHPVHGRAPARQRGTARGQQRDQQDPGGPGQPAQQGRRGVDADADRGLRVDEVTDPVGQQPADVTHVPEPRNLHATTAPTGQRVDPQRTAVDRDDAVTRPDQTARHRHEQGDHRAHSCQEFGGGDHDSGPPQGAQEEERQQQGADQTHAQWRDLDGRVRLRPLQSERRHVSVRCHGTARAQRHDRRRHRAQRARRVRVEQVQAERRRSRHADQRPAHGGDRGEQHVPPRHPGGIPLGRDARARAHGRPPDPLRGGVAAHVPLAWITTLRAGFNPVNGIGRWAPTQFSQGPTFGQGPEPEIVPPDVRHP